MDDSDADYDDDDDRVFVFSQTYLWSIGQAEKR